MISALVRMREIPFRTAGKEGQAYSVIRHWRQRYQRGPLRRCFKPRSPLSAGCAGFASGCRSHEQGGRSLLRRLSGLLSGCPPTDTRPQARAKLGVQRNKPISPRVNTFGAKRSATPNDSGGSRPQICFTEGATARRYADDALGSPRTPARKDAGAAMRRPPSWSVTLPQAATNTFLNCHGSLRSTASGNSAPRPSSGVQSV